MAPRLPSAAPLLLALAGACAAPDFDGQWVGECDAEVDLRIEVLPQDDEDHQFSSAHVNIHRPDYPDTALTLDCQDAGQDGWDVHITGCTGAWDGSTDAHDLDLSGTLDEDGVVPRLLGDCTGDGMTGTLELWWLP